MIELAAVVLFVALPAVLGYGSASYKAAAIPAVAVLAFGLLYALEPAGGNDEVDVLPGLFLAFSVLGVAICLAGAAHRRNRRRNLR